MKAALLSRKSNAADRMAWWTAAAETFPLQQALDRPVHIENLPVEMDCVIVRVATITDNVSLRILYSGKTAKELRLRRELADARDLLMFDRIRVRFVPTDYIFADLKTKSMRASNFLQLGRMNILEKIGYHDI